MACLLNGNLPTNINMKKEISKLMLLVVIVFLLTNISFVDAEEELGCPVIDAYFHSDKYYYECRSGYDLEKFDWYIRDENEKFNKMDVSYQSMLTYNWVQEGLKIKGKEELIKGKGMNLDFAPSNGLLKLSFVEEDSFFTLYNDSFTNILPRSLRTGRLAFLKFDYKNEEIVEANFMVNERGGNYTLGNDSFYAPPNSTVIFSREDGIEIKFEDGVDLTNLLNFFELNKESAISIGGKNIMLPNGLNLIDGKLTISEKGYLLENGNAEYKQNFLRVNEDSARILVANQDIDLSDYEGNWMRQTSDSLELQSSKDGYINIEFLENHEILNTDDKDGMSALIEKGDGLKIETRNRRGLIPNIVHQSSEKGKTTIQNDKFEFVIDKNEFSMSPPVPLENEDFSGKYQSVAFEIESDSLNMDTKLRINSYRQFDILSKDGRSLVTWNKYELPVSARLIDNELQTIEQLRDKYPGVKFELPKLVHSDTGKPYKSFDEENMPPYLLYLTDNFFDIYPQAAEDFDKIEFYGTAAASVDPTLDTLSIGLKAFDTTRDYKTREINSPIQTLTHEYEHQLDNLIGKKEFDFMKTLNDPILNELTEKWENVLVEIQSGGYIIGTVREFKDLENLIQERYYELNPREKTLQYLYNDIVIDSMKKNFKNKNIIDAVVDMQDDIHENYAKERLYERLDNLNTPLLNYYANNQYESFAEDPRALEMFKEQYKFKTGKEHTGYPTREDLLEVFTQKSIEESVIMDIGRELSEKPFEERTQEDREMMRLEHFYQNRVRYGNLNEVSRLYYSISGDLSPFRNQINKIFEANTGLPSVYCSFDIENPKKPIIATEYGKESWGASDVVTSGFLELSSIYREQTTEQLIIKVNSPNRNIRNTYKQLTQLAFDSGKMSALEYKSIMGRNFCKEPDCLDKRCIIYKLLCCEEYPSSRHC